MGNLRSFVQMYFDHVYNPIYDATTATLSRYRALQARCLQALELQDAERLLCGVGRHEAAPGTIRVCGALPRRH